MPRIGVWGGEAGEGLWLKIVAEIELSLICDWVKIRSCIKPPPSPPRTSSCPRRRIPLQSHDARSETTKFYSKSEPVSTPPETSLGSPCSHRTTNKNSWPSFAFKTTTSFSSTRKTTPATYTTTPAASTTAGCPKVEASSTTTSRSSLSSRNTRRAVDRCP